MDEKREVAFEELPLELQIKKSRLLSKLNIALLAFIFVLFYAFGLLHLGLVPDNWKAMFFIVLFGTIYFSVIIIGFESMVKEFIVYEVILPFLRKISREDGGSYEFSQALERFIQEAVIERAKRIQAIEGLIASVQQGMSEEVDEDSVAYRDLKEQNTQLKAEYDYRRIQFREMVQVLCALYPRYEFSNHRKLFSYKTWLITAKEEGLLDGSPARAFGETQEVLP